MIDYRLFAELSPTAYADALDRSRFMDYAIRELWPRIPRIAGPAFTVALTPGDNLMLHAAIYEAPAGSVIVVDAGDDKFAVAGGNVCAIAQNRGVAGMVIDGVIRDLAEIRQSRFAVFARGVMPIPGKKRVTAPLNQPITCGGVAVAPGDIVVADEEGIVVIPANSSQQTYAIAKARTDKDAATSLGDWQREHRRKIDALLNG